MKNLILFVSIVLCYFSLAYLDKTYITTSSKIFDFLAKDYPNEVVKNYMDSQKKWWWISYAATPLFIGIKVLLVAFCLNFIKLFDLPGLDKVKFSDIITLVLIAESVFIIAGFYKFVNFYWIDTDYTLENLQTYYPISLLNIKEYISTEKWLAYPLQLVNLFELFYWGILAWGIWELSDQKISFPKSLGLTTVTYGIGLLFWMGVVSFFILNAQY
ncbi:hypothetical protein [Chryseobacterium lathyri]|uniref:hypothetical protein n=1 Tax=Chryseobacterium lathyri TaxID=395933 RepID=UPI00277ED34F|nr:hypothetical protein [Chryseobacterium lathyri]MDQ0065166.1 TRAP-type C4-dicarboxylate transport system permease small subunit [Chryseobacterium lathyri]